MQGPAPLRMEGEYDILHGRKAPHSPNPNRNSTRYLGISSWGGKLTDHMTLRPWRGEGRPHNYNILGGGGRKLGQFGGGGGGGGSFPCAPPPIDETLNML